MDKCFIITDLDFEELEVDIAERIEEFIEEKLGAIASRQTEVSVEYQEYMDDNMKCPKDQFRCELWIDIKFNQYKYKHNPEHEERIESIGSIFEYKGRKPFYINGEFVSRHVFEWTTGMPIQKAKLIHGIGKDELSDMFDDLIMDC